MLYQASMLWALLAVCCFRTSSGSEEAEPEVDDQGRIPFPRAPVPGGRRIFQDMVGSEVLDNAAGAAMGLSLGDAMGGPMEFGGAQGAQHPDVIKAFQMTCTANKFNGQPMGKGETTDDTAMSLAKARALCQCDASLADIDQKTLEAYKQWANGPPRFWDVGITIGRVLGQAANPADARRIAAEVSEDTKKQFGSPTLSNGVLMRATPLALYGLQLPLDQLEEFVASDVTLTNNNPHSVVYTTAYVVALRYLIATPIHDINNQQEIADRANAAIAAARDYLGWTRLGNVEYFTDTKERKALMPGTVSQLLLEWITESIDDPGSMATATGRVGRAWTEGMSLIAFQRVFHHLSRQSSFDQAMLEVIGEGGDTDTNAAIVGSVMGALRGMSQFKQWQIQSVMNCKPAPSHGRAELYQGKLFWKEDVLTCILAAAPARLAVPEEHRPAAHVDPQPRAAASSRSRRGPRKRPDQPQPQREAVPARSRRDPKPPREEIVRPRARDDPPPVMPLHHWRLRSVTSDNLPENTKQPPSHKWRFIKGETGRNQGRLEAEDSCLSCGEAGGLKVEKTDSGLCTNFHIVELLLHQDGGDVTRADKLAAHDPERDRVEIKSVNGAEIDVQHYVDGKWQAVGEQWVQRVLVLEYDVPEDEEPPSD